MIIPTANRYPCGDGKWIVLNMPEDSAWRKLCGVIGREDWLVDERLQDIPWFKVTGPGGDKSLNVQGSPLNAGTPTPVYGITPVAHGTVVSCSVPTPGGDPAWNNRSRLTCDGYVASNLGCFSEINYDPHDPTDFLGAHFQFAMCVVDALIDIVTKI